MEKKMACWLHMLLILLCIGLSNVKSKTESLPEAGRHLPDSEDLFIGLSYVKTEPESLTEAGRLPNSEVEALKEIAAQLEKNSWNFTVNPCNDPSWIRTSSYGSNSMLNCSCSFPNGICHVINIFIKRESLAGILPPALAKLPYLKAVDFNRNNFRGAIPKEWASIKLKSLSRSANNLSGPIDCLGKITTLKFPSLESNLFAGPVPPVLGNLVDLEKLVLSANNFTGVLRTNLTNLTKLREFKINSNNFTGRVPNFFQSWKQLQNLDLSFNRLEGKIPDFGNLTKLTTIYLTRNLLSGPLPEWITSRDSR